MNYDLFKSLNIGDMVYMLIRTRFPDEEIIDEVVITKKNTTSIYFRFPGGNTEYRADKNGIVDTGIFGVSWTILGSSEDAEKYETRVSETMDKNDKIIQIADNLKYLSYEEIDELYERIMKR